jgi:four helix bundle protein
MGSYVKDFRELKVYLCALQAATEVFNLTRQFPCEEKFSLPEQVVKSSRSVCANIAEAWRKRRYSKSFLSSLTIAEGEAAETRVWLEIAYKCGYLNEIQYNDLEKDYNSVAAMLNRMIQTADKWTQFHR